VVQQAIEKAKHERATLIIQNTEHGSQVSGGENRSLIMAASTPDEHLTWYVINYFGGLMTEPEWLAHRAFIGQRKAEHSDCPELMEESNTKDPDALALMSEGQQQFMRRARDRILRDHPDKVFLNNCPRCGGLAMTPTAQQCRWCFYDWHPASDPEQP